jgi:hypothetical protein
MKQVANRATWRRYVRLKRRLIFSGLCDIIYQKVELFNTLILFDILPFSLEIGKA